MMLQPAASFFGDQNMLMSAVVTMQQEARLNAKLDIPPHLHNFPAIMLMGPLQMVLFVAAVKTVPLSGHLNQTSES